MYGTILSSTTPTRETYTLEKELYNLAGYFTWSNLNVFSELDCGFNVFSY